MVACLCQGAVRGKGQGPDAPDDRRGNRPLGRLLHTGKDPAEGTAVLRQSGFHGAVVDGAEVAQVEGGGVRYEPLLPEMCLVAFHQGGVELIKSGIPVLAEEAEETVGGGGIGLGQAYLAGLPEPVGQDLHEAAQVIRVARMTRAGCAVGFHHLPGCVILAVQLQPADETVEPLQFFLQLRLQVAEVDVSLLIAGRKAAVFPFIREYLASGVDLSGHPPVSHPII